MSSDKSELLAGLDDGLDDLPRYMAVVQKEEGWLPGDPGVGPMMKACVYVDDVRDMLRRLVPKFQRPNPDACGLCGGYGSWNSGKQQAVPCMACGKQSEGLVLVATEDVARPLRPSIKPQIGGLQLIEGGANDGNA